MVEIIPPPASAFAKHQRCFATFRRRGVVPAGTEREIEATIAQPVTYRPAGHAERGEKRTRPQTVFKPLPHPLGSSGRFSVDGTSPACILLQSYEADGAVCGIGQQV